MKNKIKFIIKNIVVLSVVMTVLSTIIASVVLSFSITTTFVVATFIWFVFATSICEIQEYYANQNRPKEDIIKKMKISSNYIRDFDNCYKNTKLKKSKNHFKLYR